MYDICKHSIRHLHMQVAVTHLQSKRVFKVKGLTDRGASFVHPLPSQLNAEDR